MIKAAKLTTYKFPCKVIQFQKMSLHLETCQVSGEMIRIHIELVENYPVLVSDTFRFIWKWKLILRY